MKKIALLVCAAISLASCSKESRTRNQVQNAGVVTAHSESGCRLLTDQQIEEIGVRHNEALHQAFLNFDFDAINVKNELYDRFKTQSLPAEISSSAKEEILNNPPMLEKQLALYGASKLVSIYIHEGENAIGQSSNLIELQKKLNLLESKARQELQCGALEIVLVNYSVLRNSAYFWLPVEEGGSGEGAAILSKIERRLGLDKTTLSKAQVTKVLAGDGAAAAGVFTSYGLLAGLTGPMGGTALLASVAFGAAWGSGCTALGI